MAGFFEFLRSMIRIGQLVILIGIGICMVALVVAAIVFLLQVLRSR